MSSKIAYIHDENLRKQCDKLPTMFKRASVVLDLIGAYQILNDKNVTITPSIPASDDELKYFHSSAYVEFLKKANNCDNLDVFDEEQLEFGLGYDCPIIENIYDFAKTIAGGSLTAAKLLTEEAFNIAINWYGGWHHAQRNEAEGFCYVNDIVIAIQKLSEKYKRILYVDLDVHHGNGVQNAFELSQKILTLSFHKYLPGFYPGSGSLHDTGSLKGKYYSINVPFLEGISNENYLWTFMKIFPKILEVFKPNAIVVQCGADIIVGDPLGQCNLTPEAMGKCVQQIINCKLPTLLLGGGGYNFANTARYWAYLTSLIVGKELDEDIPDNCGYFTEYGPTYELTIKQGNQKDCNTKEYLSDVIKQIYVYCDLIDNK